MSGLSIYGTGSYVPPHTVTNQMFEEHIDTNDEWIKSRTGISERGYANGESHLDMVSKAARRALEASGVDVSEIGAVICASFTADYKLPSLACLLQRELGLPEHIFAFDINAACTGFVYSLCTAHSLLGSGHGKYALVTGSEILTKLVDFTDRSTCVLFGDGAGAAVIGIDDQSEACFHAGAKGGTEALHCVNPEDSKNPFFAYPQKKKEGNGFIFMDGSEVFRFAVESMTKSIQYILEKAGLEAGDVAHYVCHQANERILKSAAKRLGVPLSRFFMNISAHGNTSAASIPIALDELNKSGALHRGDKVVLSGFGGGLTYGSACFTW